MLGINNKRLDVETYKVSEKDPNNNCAAVTKACKTILKAEGMIDVSSLILYKSKPVLRILVPFVKIQICRSGFDLSDPDLDPDPTSYCFMSNQNLYAISDLV